MAFAGMNLNEAEQKLIDAAQKGEVCNLQSEDADDNDPANGESWGEERTVRAEVIRMLCVGADPQVRVDYRGVQLWGARITEELDLNQATINFPMGLIGCLLEEPLGLTNARTRNLLLNGSHLPAVFGQGATIDGGFQCAGGLFSGYDLPGRGLTAALLDAAEIRGILGLGEGFRAQGHVSLMQARIVGQVNCGGGTFESRAGDGVALAADGIMVTGDLLLGNRFSAKGTTRLTGAEISGQLQCNNGKFMSGGGDRHALTLGEAQVGGAVHLSGEFEAQGTVFLAGATITGQLSCRGGRFTASPEGGLPAIVADELEVGRDVQFDDSFRAAGGVRMPGASVLLPKFAGKSGRCWRGSRQRS